MEISILGSDMKNNLKIVLDYVERYNKFDEDIEVAHAHHDLESLLEEVKAE